MNQNIFTESVKNRKVKMVNVVSDALLESLFAVDQIAFAASEVACVIPQQQHGFSERNPLSLLPYESCSPSNQSQNRCIFKFHQGPGTNQTLGITNYDLCHLFICCNKL